MQENYSNLDFKQIAFKAKKAASSLSLLKTETKNLALSFLSELLLKEEVLILKENKKDLEKAKEVNLKASLIDRLTLNSARLKSLSQAVKSIEQLGDPVGEIVYSKKIPNGLTVYQERVSIGVLFVIFESRPNVVIDIASLCLKSGNACILRGGREAAFTNRVFSDLILKSFEKANISLDGMQLIDDVDRTKMKGLLTEKSLIDLVIPRGGKGLIDYVLDHTSIPVIKHDSGLCHLFVDANAKEDMAKAIVINAKTQRPGVCNAIETLLIHKKYSAIQSLLRVLLDSGLEILGDEESTSFFKEIKKATLEDFQTEFLAMKLSVKIVTNLDEAIKWINTYSSHHTDGIVTESYENQKRFLEEVDSACVLVNASTRFSDGGCFGLGAEVGISTEKLHARGPMGVRDLTTFKYKVYGEGHIRS